MINVSTLKKTALLIFGLPGSGKTTLSEAITRQIRAEHIITFNADKVRSTLSKDLGFKFDDRIEQARRMGCIASLALDASSARICVVDFVNPNVDTWSTFQKNLAAPKGNRVSDINRIPEAALELCEYPVFSVWMNTIKPEECRFADTAEIFNSGGRPVDFEVGEFVSNPADFDRIAAEVIASLKLKVGHGR